MNKPAIFLDNSGAFARSFSAPHWQLFSSRSACVVGSKQKTMEKLQALLSIILVVQLVSVSPRPLLKIGEDVDNSDVNSSITITNSNELIIGFDLVISFIIFLIIISVFGLHCKYRKLFLQMSTSLINLRCQVSNMAIRRDSQQTRA